MHRKVSLAFFLADPECLLSLDVEIVEVLSSETSMARINLGEILECFILNLAFFCFISEELSIRVVFSLGLALSRSSLLIVTM